MNIVVTIINDGERDLFADIVYVTPDDDKAHEVESALKEFIISGKKSGLNKLRINHEHLSKPIGGWGIIKKEINGTF